VGNFCPRIGEEEKSVSKEASVEEFGMLAGRNVLHDHIYRRRNTRKSLKKGLIESAHFENFDKKLGREI